MNIDAIKLTVHILMKKFRFVHIIADHNATNKTGKNNKPILYFDESRFGNKTKTGLEQFVKGSRTPVKVKLGFKNFYLFQVLIQIMVLIS